MGDAIIEGQLTSCLLDNGAVVNLVTPEYAQAREFPVLPMSDLTCEKEF